MKDLNQIETIVDSDYRIFVKQSKPDLLPEIAKN